MLIWGEECSRKGRYEAAERLYQRASLLVEKTLGQRHPTMAEVLECYSDLLRRTHRSEESIAMKKRAEAIGKVYSARFCWTYIPGRSVSNCCLEGEGSDSRAKVSIG